MTFYDLYKQAEDYNYENLPPMNYNQEPNEKKDYSKYGDAISVLGGGAATTGVGAGIYGAYKDHKSTKSLKEAYKKAIEVNPDVELEITPRAGVEKKELYKQLKKAESKGDFLRDKLLNGEISDAKLKGADENTLREFYKHIDSIKETPVLKRNGLMGAAVGLTALGGGQMLNRRLKKQQEG